MNNPLPILPLSAIPPDAHILVIPLTGWVPKALFEKVKGLSDGQIRGKIDRKTWKPGIHYAVRDGGTYINIEAYEAWVTEQSILQVLDPATTIPASRSDGNIKEGRLSNTFQKSRQKLT